MSSARTSRRIVTDDGVVLHADAVGDGPPVIILHGLGYAGWAAEPLRRRLRGKFTVWSIDNRGSGRSAKPPGPYSVQRMADDAATLLDELDPAHLIGYSMGGYIAQIVASQYRQSVRTLTLLSTSAGGPTAQDVPAETRRTWADHAHLPPASFADATMPLSFAADWVEAHPADFRVFLDQRLAFPTPPDAWQSQYAAASAFIADGYDTSRVRAPVLIVHGDEDRVVPVHNGRDLARRIPSARYHEIPGGHLVHLEHPDLVAGLFVDFIDASASFHHR